MTTIAGIDPAESKAGLVFWYVDVNNFYVFELAEWQGFGVPSAARQVALAGRLARRQGVDAGDRAINEFARRDRRQQANLFVNGNEFEELKGSPPDNGQQVGVFSASPAGEPRPSLSTTSR